MHSCIEGTTEFIGEFQSSNEHQSHLLIMMVSLPTVLSCVCSLLINFISISYLHNDEVHLLVEPEIEVTYLKTRSI